jgi:hypothetical protein
MEILLSELDPVFYDELESKYNQENELIAKETYTEILQAFSTLSDKEKYVFQAREKKESFAKISNYIDFTDMHTRNILKGALSKLKEKLSIIQSGDLKKPAKKLIIMYDKNNREIAVFKSIEYAAVITGFEEYSIFRSLEKDSILMNGYYFEWFTKNNSNIKNILTKIYYRQYYYYKYN